MNNDDLLSLIQLHRNVEWRYRLDLYEAAELQALDSSVRQAEKEILTYVDRRGASLGEFSERRALGVLDETSQLRFGIRASLAGGVENIATTAGIQSVLEHNNILSFDGLIPGFKEFNLTAEQIRSLIRDTPIGGETLSNWMSSMDQGILDKIKQEVTTGMVKGDDYRAFRKRLQQGFDFSRREATTLARTYVQSVNVGAMKGVYNANRDLIKGVKWLATLESGFKKSGRGTCIRCAMLDGHEFDLDKHPECPLHPRCRCVLLPVLPTFRELGINMDEVQANFRPYTDRRDVSIDVGRDAQLTVLETGFHNGNYASWVQTRGMDFQRNLVGPRRYDLLRSGRIGWDDLVDVQTGRLRLLDELEGGRMLPSRRTPIGETFGGVLQQEMVVRMAEIKAAVQREEAILATKAVKGLVQDPWTGEWVTTRQLAARKAVRTRKGLVEPPKPTTTPKPVPPPKTTVAERLPKAGLVQDPFTGEWITSRQLAARKAVRTRQAAQQAAREPRRVRIEPPKPKPEPKPPTQLEKLAKEQGSPDWWSLELRLKYRVDLEFTDKTKYGGVFQSVPGSPNKLRYKFIDERNFKDTMESLEQYLRFCKDNKIPMPSRICVDHINHWNKFRSTEYYAGFERYKDTMHISTISSRSQVLEYLRSDARLGWGGKVVDNLQPFMHETGHKLHFMVLEERKLMKSGLPTVPAGFKSEKSFSRAERAMIQKKLGRYATESPMEFVAETYGNNMLGMRMDDDIWALYQKWQGPSTPEFESYLRRVGKVIKTESVAVELTPQYFVTKFKEEHEVNIMFTKWNEERRNVYRPAFDARPYFDEMMLNEKNLQELMSNLDEYIKFCKANGYPYPKNFFIDNPIMWRHFKSDGWYAGYQYAADSIHITTNHNMNQMMGMLRRDVEMKYGSIAHRHYSFAHETGHKLHYDRLGEVVKGWEWEVPAEYRNFNNFSVEELTMIRRQLGTYAAASPMEFVADAYGSNILGKKYPDAVWELYHKWNGPNCPGYLDWLRKTGKTEEVAFLAAKRAPVLYEEELASSAILKDRNLGGGVNTSRLLEFEEKVGPRENLKGVFKPISGESVVYDTIMNRTEFSLAHREVAAYEVANKLQNPYVPETVMREVDLYGNGSVQRFVKGAKLESLWYGRDLNADEVYQIGIFDVIIGNTDRHARNFMRLADGTPVLIDNGLAFPKATRGFSHGLEEFFNSVLVSDTSPTRFQGNKMKTLDSKVKSSTTQKIRDAVNDTGYWENFITKYNLNDAEASALRKRLEMVGDAVNTGRVGELFRKFHLELWEGFV